jgi:AcrR family transcriptional regulator
VFEMVGEEKEKPLRADAERNRRRLLDAAESLFRERGLDVGVGEIAQRAGVGRGTLFRNFPSKEHLIAAIVVDRIGEAIVRGKELVRSGEPDTALFEFLDEIVGRQQRDRALFDAVADTIHTSDAIRTAQAEMIGVLDALLARAQEAGAVRKDVAAMDVMMLVKGVCQAASVFERVDPDIADRHLDLMRAALTAHESTRPLRGRAPTIEDIEHAFDAEAAEQSERATA